MKVSALAACLAACMTCGTAIAIDRQAAVAVQQDLDGILRVAKAQPAPASALLTDRQVLVDLASANWRGHRLALLVLRDTAATPRLVAVVSRRHGSPARDASYHWFPATAGNAQPQAIDLAALEHLYRLAENDAPTDTYRFAAAASSGRAPGRNSGPALTHAQLLARIAEARERVAGALRLAGTAAPKPWRTVSIELVPQGADRKHVAARLNAAHGPMVGATILFTRAPHLECSATTDRTGLAACRLEDTHGHEDDHEGADAKTIAAFPGDVQSEMVLLPTTSVR